MILSTIQLNHLPPVLSVSHTKPQVASSEVYLGGFLLAAEWILWRSFLFLFQNTSQGQLSPCPQQLLGMQRRLNPPLWGQPVQWDSPHAGNGF